MVLSAVQSRNPFKHRETYSYPVYATADKFWVGGMIEMNILTGKVSPLGVQGAGSYFLGFCQKTKTTTSSSSSEISVDTEGRIEKNIVVTGASAVTDHGKLVYATSDAFADLTLTRASADAIPVGRVQRYRSSNRADVQFFTPTEAIAETFRGAGRRELPLGNFSNFTAGYLVGSATKGIKLHGSGKIAAWDVFVAKVPTNDNKTTDVTGKINDTAVTGMSATFLASANQTLGTQVATITQPSAANVFHDGDLFQLAATGGSPPTDGTLFVILYIENGL